MILDPNPALFPAAWAVAWGQDGYGLWQAFEIAGVRQVMRWIPPGRFEMGSPEGEPERLAHETRHTVTLTQGYWLAESACTQQLWQAVMGDNPAHFDDSGQCPVERVSWLDCEIFLGRANAVLNDELVLRFPTEAEWECACRAGSSGPFSWGESLNSEQANYKGTQPYTKDKKGRYRGHTVEVLSFDANPWGLYQMHGNVWEWCADWLGPYPEYGVIDPTGSREGQARVLRGGSWFDFGRYLRSAFRVGFRPDARYRAFGLRLAGGVDPQARPQARQPLRGVVEAEP